MLVIIKAAHPDCRKTNQPEEEEANEVARICPRGLGETRMQIFEAGPDAPDHQVDAGTFKSRLTLL